MESISFAKKFGVELKGEIIVKGKKEFLVSSSLKEVMERIPLESKAVGTFLGEMASTGFRPSLALLDLLKDSDNKLTINEEAEWLFTCGRDVFKDNVTKEGTLKNKFLVMNKLGEVLGLGKKEKDGDKVIIKNIFDRGDFLRREDRKKNRKK